MKSRRKRRYALAALLAAVVATAGFAFTNTSTVSGSFAGDGTGVVSGYAIDNVKWDLNDTDPLLVDDVTFDLNEVVTEVKIRVTESGDGTSGWLACGAPGGAPDYTVSCDLTGQDVDTVQLTGLEVASAS